MMTATRANRRSCSFPALLLLLLLPPTLLVAQDAAAREQAVREFLLGPPTADAPTGLGTAAQVRRAVEAVLAARRRLAPGYHLLGDAALLVPRAAAGAGPHPLLVVSEPARLSAPPDELPLRALYAPWLELGWLVLAPAASPFAAQPGRRPEIGPLLARACLNAAVDRDRVLLVSPIAGRLSPLGGVTAAFHGETTALAGLYDVLPAASLPGSEADLEAWTGRVITMHLSEHNPDEALIHARRLQLLQRQGLIDLMMLRDPALDWPGRLHLDTARIRKIALAVTRRAARDTLSFLAGRGATRHEWVETPGLGAALRIVAERREDEIRLRTPQVPRHERFSSNLYLERRAPRVTVFLNNRVVSSGSVPEDAAAVLLLARYELQTGRLAAAVVRVR